MSDISFDLGPPDHDSITTVDGCWLKVFGKVMLPFAIGFGASELVKVTEDAIIPVRIVNPSARPVKIFRKTRLGDFENLEDRIETFQLSEAPEEFTYTFNTREKHSQAELIAVT